MRDAVAFILGNFTLTFFVLGLLASAIALWQARQPRTAAVVVEALFSYFLLFSIGVSSLYNFVLPSSSGSWRRPLSDGKTVPSSWRSALRAWALPCWDCWRSGEASICDWRPLSDRPASCGARPAATSPRTILLPAMAASFFQRCLVPIFGFIF